MMKITYAVVLVVTLAVLAEMAWGQHQHRPAPAAPASPVPVENAHAGDAAYRSPFADYRPFKAEEPMKDWRKANDEVREAGGHIGLTKGQPAQLTGHGAHGAKQPVPPAQDKK